MPEVLRGKATATPDWAKAAGLLEQSLRVGNREPQTSYLLAMCYKKLGRTADARAALGKIAEPDANVYLQRGVLAYGDKDFAQAEIDFARSWDIEPASYSAGYNLLLSQLCQNKPQEIGPVFDRLIPLAPTAEEKHFLSLLRALFQGDAAGKASLPAELQQRLAAISSDDEARLIGMFSGFSQSEAALPLLQSLRQARPQSEVIWQAFCRMTLVQGKDLMDRCKWKEARAVLDPLSRLTSRPDSGKLPALSRLALLNMLGTCACMLQEFELGIGFFRSAMDLFQKDPELGGGRNPKHLNSRGIGQQAWLEQNLALAYEWQGKLDKAEAHWGRYFDQLEQGLAESTNLAFEGLSRLADLFTQKERWNAALGFLLRAHKFKPNDADVLERLFHLYEQMRKPDEARKILRRLREVRPNDAQVDLFELNVRDVRDIHDLNNVMGELRRVLQKHPGSVPVEERVSGTINNLMPFMDRLYEQWSGQISKVLEQMRRLPSYQINWPMVREVMHELEDKFFLLRKAASKAQGMVQGTLRRDLQRLSSQCDRKMEQCHSLAE